MAKKKPNQSERVRRYLRANPDEKPVNIAKKLRVKSSLVYNVKSKMVKVGELPDTGRGASSSPNGRTAKQAATVQRSKRSAGGVETVRMTADFVKACGGLDQARQALDALEEVVQIVG